MLANCGHDERGAYSGGKAGDNTGGEWNLVNFYAYPWNAAYEPPTRAIGVDVALLATNAAKNDHIGYDQSQRTTFYTQLMKVANYDPANIKVDCETDCSAGTSAIVIAAGKRNANKKMAAVSPNCWTGNLGDALVAAGWKKHTDIKYLTSDKYLGKGWIMLNYQCHVAINVTDGSGYVDVKTCKATKKLWLRSNHSMLAKYRIKTIPKGTKLKVSEVYKGKLYKWGKLSDGSGWIRLSATDYK